MVRRSPVSRVGATPGQLALAPPAASRRHAGLPAIRSKNGPATTPSHPRFLVGPVASTRDTLTFWHWAPGI